MIELGSPSRGHVTQWFAQRQLQDGQPHAGQDWAYRNNATGEVFDGAYAMADGVVAWADDTRKLGWPNPWYFNPDFDRTDDVDTSAGNAVVLKHWFGWTTYCHLEETPLNIGDQVKRGQRVGTVGATGYSAGKHLHSDLILNGADVSKAPLYGRSDPNPYFTAAITPQSSTITPQEDDLSKQAEDDIARIKQILEAVENDGIRARVIAIDNRTADAGEVTKYVKGDSDASLYEILDGKLRGITLTEWQATGRAYRVLPQSIIDALPKAG